MQRTAMLLDDRANDPHAEPRAGSRTLAGRAGAEVRVEDARDVFGGDADAGVGEVDHDVPVAFGRRDAHRAAAGGVLDGVAEDVVDRLPRSEEHTSELQSLMRISYAVFCLKKKKLNITTQKL